MRRTRLIHIRRIEGLAHNRFQALFESIKEFGFNEVNGHGFIDANLDELHLSATLILRKLTYRTIFDPATNTFSRQENTYFEQVPFFIDSKFGTLEVLSNATNARQVVSILGELLHFQLAIGDMGFSPADVLNVVGKLKRPFTLKKFTINNFVASPGVSGKYTPEVSYHTNGASIIREQEADVTRVTLILNFSIEENVELTVSSNGGLTIVCDEDNLIDILDETKTWLFGERDNG